MEMGHSIEWSDVVANATANPDPVWKDECHFGYLVGIMVEKGAEFPVGDARRYFKYRVVFQGNQVKDQDWNVALFQEMASTPATLDASRIADAYACFPGHHLGTRDVEQAYLQAKLKGPQTWIMLPKEIWKDSMFGMRWPVVRLELALYGHKHSGNFWEDECTARCLQAGFEPFEEEWPGCTGILTNVYCLSCM